MENQLGELTNALKTLDQAESAVPNDPHIPYIRAVILVRNGRYKEARFAVNRALKTQPDFEAAIELRQELSTKTQ